ncbi:MAG: PEPxxWA-CTERM sorting domain-containing protein [Pseudomonadota bacterium]
MNRIAPLRSRLLIPLLITLGTMSAARADVLVNGSFEGSVAPWTFTSGIVASSLGTAHATDGSSVAQISLNSFFGSASGTLSQSFVLASGGLFNYAFQAGRSEGACVCNDVALTFAMRIDGVILSTDLPAFDSSSGGSPVSTRLLTSYSGALALSAGTHEIAFEFSRGDTGFGRGPYFVIDGVGLVPQVAAVPEPSTWAMMLLGFIGTGAAAYRRRKNAVAAATA